MKTLLINPPFYRFIGLEQDYVPLSLLAVGSCMSFKGHEVYLKNFELDKSLSYRGYKDRAAGHDLYLKALENDKHPVWKEVRDMISDVNPDTVGITVLNVKYRSAMKVAEIARELGKKVMVGGAHPTVCPEGYPEWVNVIQGEYEMDSFGAGRVQDLDSLVMPDYDILMDSYSPEGYAHVTSSRGCPYKCRFCATSTIWGRKVTYKSIDYLLQEMREIHSRFANKYFTIWDETFTVNRKRTLEFCEKYDIPAGWRCDTRADRIDEELAISMQKAGCESLSIGIECGSPHMLEYIGKGEEITEFVRVAQILRNIGLQWKAYCIVGFPEDTEEEIQNTLRFITSLEPTRITLSFFTPYVGTELYKECENLGLINEGYESALYAHQSPYNHFCPKIPRERYNALKEEISYTIDEYNKEAIKSWK
jgi:radical SAM superfamily enzyme YgiQ (UPF0313 family)